MSKFISVAIGAALVVGSILTYGTLTLALASTLGSFLVTTGASLVLSGVGSLLSKDASGAASTGTSVASRNPIAPWNAVYGRAKVGGTIVYIEETGYGNSLLHLVMVLACHPCESVDALLFDGQRILLDQNGNSYTPSQTSVSIASIQRANDVVTVHLSNPLPGVDGATLLIQNVSDRTMNGRYQVSQASDTVLTYICGGNPGSASGGSVDTTHPNYGSQVSMDVLLGNHTSTFPRLLASTNGIWTNKHLLRGRTAVYLQLGYHPEYFANGLPSISFLVRGKNDIYDPRTGTKGYTENAALCIADFLAHPAWGFRAGYGSYLPEAPLIGAANVCDEPVALASGGTEPRYAANGTFQLSTGRGTILQNLLTSCAGRLSYQGGQFLIQPAAWQGASVSIGADAGAASSAVNMLMNDSGLVVNAYNNQAGRGDYFSEAAGTSEGQFLLALGLLDAYSATGNPSALALANTALSHVLEVLYRGNPIPAAVDRSGNNFAPHWLFSVKHAFRMSVIHYKTEFPFTNGSAQIPDAPGGPLHYVFQVVSPGYKLLWANPYSVLVTGSSYPFTYSTSGGVTTVTLNGAQASFTGSLAVIHSTLSGGYIKPDDPFEAWPDWRLLADGEIDAACDTFNWAYRCYQRAAALLGAPWDEAARATLEQTALAYDVNDSRDWVRPSYTRNPFSDGSRFSYYNHTDSLYYDPWLQQFTNLPAPQYSADAKGQVLLAVGSDPSDPQNPVILAGYNPPNGPQGFNETDGAFDGYQYGNASVLDQYKAGDSTAVVLGFFQFYNSQPPWMGNVYWASLVKSLTGRVYCYIDTTQQTPFDPANRYRTATFLVDPPDAQTHTAPGAVNLQDLPYNAFAGAANGDGTYTFTFTRTDFQNANGDILPQGSEVYTFGVCDLTRLGHRLTIGRVRQLPNRNILYYPGATPFTANFLGNPATLIDWRGPVYMGYMSAWMWRQTCNDTGVGNVVQMLADAQAAWQMQTGQPDIGPFAPVFLFDRADAVQYGAPNSFTWNGPDPNTRWGGYQYRPLLELAYLVANCSGSESYYAQALASTNSFLAWIDAHWMDATTGPPTDFPPGPAEVNYPEPHFVALIVHSALVMDDAANSTYASLLEKAVSFWSYWYQSSGPMAGTFCTDVENRTWFGFWHGEILRALSLLVEWGAVHDPAKQALAETWIAGMVDWAAANVVSASAGSNVALENASGSFEWRPKLSIRDLYNGVKGVYVSPGNNWETSDIPPYAQDGKHGYSNGPAAYSYDANLALDRGDRRWFDVQLPFTISAAAAQRLAKIELLRKRQQGTGSFSFNLWMYQLAALDIVEFTLPALRWEAKLLEVAAHRFTLNRQNIDGSEVVVLGAEVDLQETDPSVYEWDVAEELTPHGYQQAVLPARGNPSTQVSYGSLTDAPVFTVDGV